VKEQPKILEIGKAEVTRNFFGEGRAESGAVRLGNLHSLACKTADQLAAEGWDCAVITRASPSRSTRADGVFGRAAEIVLTFEDHALAGGYGSSVVELFNEKRITAPVICIGWPDQFIEHASSVDYLREKYGLTAAAAIAQVKALLEKQDQIIPRAAQV